MIYFDGTLVLLLQIDSEYVHISLCSCLWFLFIFFLVNGYGDEYCLLHNLGF